MPRKSVKTVNTNLDVEKENGMGAVGLEPLSVVFSVTFYTDIVHKGSPLLLEQIFAPLNTIEEEVACPRGEMVWIIVASSMKIQGDMGVNPHREVVVEDTQRLQNNKVLSVQSYQRGQKQKKKFFPFPLPVLIRYVIYYI